MADRSYRLLLGGIVVAGLIGFAMWRDAKQDLREAEAAREEARFLHQQAFRMESGRSGMCDTWLSLTNPRGQFREDVTEAEIRAAHDQGLVGLAATLLESVRENRKLFRVHEGFDCMSVDDVLSEEARSQIDELCRSDPFYAGLVVYHRSLSTCSGTRRSP